MYTRNNRINLLSDLEIDAIYSFPSFNAVEQSLYFEFTDLEIAIAKKYRTIKSQVCFMLCLGYFKAKQQFYTFNLSSSRDAQYILEKYFDKNNIPLSGEIDYKTYQKQKFDILTLLDYQEWSPKYQPQIELRVCELLKFYPKGHSALRQLLGYLNNQRIVIPSYRKLQDMFTAAFSIEESRLNQIILSMPLFRQKQLSALINRNKGISQLNIIRADQKDFHYTAVRAEVEKAQEIADLYEFSKNFIPTLELSKNAVRYYADVAEQYAAFRLRPLRKPQQLLYTLCFIYHRYQQIMGNLVTSFMYHTRTIMEAGKTYAGLAMMEHSAALVVDFPKLAQFLEWFPERNKDLDHDALNQVAYSILPEEQFLALAKFLKGNIFDKTAAKWEFYLKSSRMFSLYLRPIFMAVQFEHCKKDNKVMELINLLKNHYASGKNPSMFKLSDDLGFTIPKNMTPYLKRKPTDEQIDPYLFEFFVYQKMYHQLDRGVLCCNNSISYCDIDKDLINDALVDDIEKIAGEFGYPKIPIYCDERLEDAVNLLDNAWDITTKNIRLRYNPGFNLKETKTGQLDWSLLYDSSEELDDTFFKTLPRVELIDVVMFIGNRIDMWSGFTHMKDRYTKRKRPDTLAVNACLMSEAFGIDEMKMAEMSDLNFNLLRSTREDFIRVDTLCAVNDKVSNYICSLPIFKRWNILDDKLLADADGQKFTTSNSTIQSRYSKKYLGKGKGISLYTLIANFVAVNAKNIGLNEYEGHALYDMIYGNKTDIDIDMVTGDKHSLNQLNFIALDAIDVEYVPSIKNIREAANDLYSIKSPDAYVGLIQPKDKINVDRIKSQKRGILRVLLSLIMQENTQSSIIRKLNSHTRYVRLRAALYEYNKIFKSIHILNLIDNMQLRKALRKARNRTESYHQLQMFIRKVYHGVFKGKKIVDNRVSAHATRLIANCIIAYNSIILNVVYEKMINNGVTQEIIDEFCRISPIAWVHILFTGRYSFKKSNGVIDIAEMARWLEMHLKQHFWKVPNSD
jgi:TnpA family transposase